MKCLTVVSVAVLAVMTLGCGEKKESAKTAETPVHKPPAPVQAVAVKTEAANVPETEQAGTVKEQGTTGAVPGRAAAVGDKVAVLYTGTLDDGTVFDASERHGNVPFELEAGGMGAIKGFSNAVVGMKVGEKKKVHIPMAEAYGPYDPKRVHDVPRTEFPAGMELTQGQRLMKRLPDGRGFPVVVKAVSDTSVTIDENHPMAGKDLNFEIEVVRIEPGSR